MQRTHWIVVTGAPCSGKTSVIRTLENNGYEVVHETARALIDHALAQGLTLEAVKADELTFERQVLSAKIAAESSLNKNRPIFLDRAIPDSIAYFRKAGFDITRPWQTAAFFNTGRFSSLRDSGLRKMPSDPKMMSSLPNWNNFWLKVMSSSVTASCGFRSCRWRNERNLCYRIFKSAALSSAVRSRHFPTASFPSRMPDIRIRSSRVTSLPVCSTIRRICRFRPSFNTIRNRVAEIRRTLATRVFRPFSSIPPAISAKA